MIHILIVGFIGFANADEEAFDPAACVKDNTCDMSTLTTEQQNELLAYIKNNVNDEDFTYRDNAQEIAQDILRENIGKDNFQFTISEDVSLDTLEITTDDNTNILEVEINNKKFNIDLENIPDEVKGLSLIHISEPTRL